MVPGAESNHRHEDFQLLAPCIRTALITPDVLEKLRPFFQAITSSRPIHAERTQNDLGRVTQKLHKPSLKVANLFTFSNLQRTAVLSTSRPPRKSASAIPVFQRDREHFGLQTRKLTFRLGEPAVNFCTAASLLRARCVEYCAQHQKPNIASKGGWI